MEEGLHPGEIEARNTSSVKFVDCLVPLVDLELRRVGEGEDEGKETAVRGATGGILENKTCFVGSLSGGSSGGSDSGKDEGVIAGMVEPGPEIAYWAAGVIALQS